MNRIQTNRELIRVFEEQNRLRKERIINLLASIKVTKRVIKICISQEKEMIEYEKNKKIAFQMLKKFSNKKSLTERLFPKTFDEFLELRKKEKRSTSNEKWADQKWPTEAGEK